MASEREETITKEMQAMANATILSWLVARAFGQSGDPEGMADEWLRMAEQLCDVMTFPHLGPVESDFAVQTLRDAMVRQLQRAKALATGEPYDPESFRPRQD